MPNPQTGKFQIDFENLINVLAENLYSDPKAAIRELIQNANDSIVRRIAFYQEQSISFVPTIHITTHRESRQLIIEDNGAGMIEREVINYLARIGGGRTREDRRTLVTKDPQATTLLIGQFGIGFLSSFVAAEEVIVDTLSVEHGVPVRWECKGTAEYQLSRGNRIEPGTQVILHLKQAHYDLLDEQILQDTIIRYADLIAFPIYLNESGKAVNRTNAPWYSDATEAEYAEYIQHRYNTIPLALKPIAVNQESLQVKGVLYVPPQAKEFKGRFRSVDLFQNRMYVGEDLNILPDWANFVCGDRKSVV